MRAVRLVVPALLLAGVLSAVPMTAASARPVEVSFASQGSGSPGWTLSHPVEVAPFALVGFEVPPGALVRARSATSDGPWSDWTAPLNAHSTHDHDEIEDEGEDEAELDGFTGPVWVGSAERLQVEVSGAAPEQVTAHLVPADDGEFAAATTCTADKTLPTGVPYVSRGGWGAEQPQQVIKFADQVKFGVIHHTAGSNDYTSADGCAIVKAIQNYHMHSRGWADIGYNLLVDRFGRIYEGRAGGISKNVIGAHAAGYNAGSFGVAAMGEFTDQAVSTALLNSLVDVVSWKYTNHGIDPASDATIVRDGQVLPTLVGHRDVGSTACPGRKLYEILGSIRAQVEDASGSIPATVMDNGIPVVGDWDGDGDDTPGLFHEGSWYLAVGLTEPIIHVKYGAAGDRPVVGDWDGDGIDTLGIVRNADWYLRNDLEGGNAQIRFVYGIHTDIPLVGDWDGDGRDEPGLHRGNSFRLKHQLGGGRADVIFIYGWDTDVAIAGDFDRNGIDDVGVVRDNVWRLKRSFTGGRADIKFKYARPNEGDIPVTGDWNGDHRDTVGVVRGWSWRLKNAHEGGTADILIYQLG